MVPDEDGSSSWNSALATDSLRAADKEASLQERREREENLGRAVMAILALLFTTVTFLHLISSNILYRSCSRLEN